MVKVCRFDNPPVTPFFWDSSCYMGMKGCLADGKHIGCRFCGAGARGIARPLAVLHTLHSCYSAGNYSDIECPASVCSFTDEPWTPYYWDDFCQWGMLGPGLVQNLPHSCSQLLSFLLKLGACLPSPGRM